MQIQNKPNASIFYWRVKNYQGVEVVEYEFKDGKPCILYGNNGAGKSGNIKGIYMALKGRKGYPFKSDNIVGPYSIKKIKKTEVVLGVNSAEEILEVNGTKLKRFYIHFSETENGSTSLKVTDDLEGKKALTAPREKIDALTSMFLDPVELVKTLDKPNGDRLLAEKLAAMQGYDLTPYIKKDEELFDLFQIENRELTRLKSDFETLDVPQDDWAKEFVDPASISKQLQDLSCIYSELFQSKKDLTQVENTITELLIDSENLTESLRDKRTSLDTEQLVFEELKTNKAPVEWAGTQNIEEKIAELTKELTLFREHEKKEREKKEAIENKQRAIDAEKERINNLENEIELKVAAIQKKKTEKNEAESIHKKNMGTASEVFEAYNLDPQGQDETLSDYLKRQIASVQERMQNVERDNVQVKNREKYEMSEQGIKAVEKTIQNIKKKRKENSAAKAKAVADMRGKFPHPGIIIDFKRPDLAEVEDEKEMKKSNDITVWVDFEDGRGRRTINDLSDGEKLRICTYIIIAGNTAPLNIIIIKDGAILDEDHQREVFKIAQEHGYHVILETILTTEVGALHITGGKVDYINQPTVHMKPTRSDVVLKQVKGRQIREDKSEINW